MLKVMCFILILAITILAACSTEQPDSYSMDNQDCLETELQSSALHRDLMSDRRDYIRIALHYLEKFDAPDYSAESIEEWREAGSVAVEWVMANAQSPSDPIIAGYPEFKIIQSPYYPD